MVRMKRDGWTLLTNHALVLVCLAANPDVLLRDVASSVGLTERSVQQIVGDLDQAGLITRLRVGRRNHYVVRRDERFRHPLEAGVTVGGFVDLFERRGAQRPLTGARTASRASADGSLEGPERLGDRGAQSQPAPQAATVRPRTG